MSASEISCYLAQIIILSYLTSFPDTEEHTCLVTLPSPCSEKEIVLNAWCVKLGFCLIVLCIIAVELNVSYHQTSDYFFPHSSCNPCSLTHLHSLHTETNPQMWESVLIRGFSDVWGNLNDDCCFSSKKSWSQSWSQRSIEAKGVLFHMFSLF